ncbi:MAG: hypothetical protein HY280_00605 [Nitrospinae bacterium]|nr:hypothetical protein [Nitrospinota bacterium]
MDIESFMDGLAAEMERLEMEMKSEAFLRKLLEKSDDLCLSNLAFGSAKGARAGQLAGAGSN